VDPLFIRDLTVCWSPQLKDDPFVQRAVLGSDASISGKPYAYAYACQVCAADNHDVGLYQINFPMSAVLITEVDEKKKMSVHQLQVSYKQQ
jgi:hypothetical protein